jgi:stage V sporulation protein G
LEFIKAYAIIYFDNCFLVRGLKVIKGPTGLIVSFPVKKLSDGTYWDIAFPLNDETRRMIEQAVLAEYEKDVGGSGPTKREPEDQSRCLNSRPNNSNFSNRWPVVLDVDLGHYLELENCTGMDRMKNMGT